MRRTRFMTIFFMVLAAAFFLLPEFRSGWRAPLTASELEVSFTRAAAAGQVPAARLAELAQQGEKEKEARTLAFAALHSGKMEDSIRLAEAAVKLDPKLTWVLYRMVSHFPHHPEVNNWVNRLQAWDSKNAVFYLLEAERTMTDPKTGLVSLPLDLDVLAKRLDWRQANEKGFSAPEYNNYTLEGFELDRAVLREHALDSPLVMVVSLARAPVPHFLNVRQYGRLLVEKLGPEAERAGRPQDALRYYWTAAHFGERMQVHGKTLIERLFAIGLQRDAYEKLMPLLRSQSRADAAATVEYALENIQRESKRLRGEDPIAQSSYFNWSAMMVFLFSGFVTVFGGFTLVCVLYVNAKQFIRKDKKGRIYEFLTTAENYAPILFFVACVGLYVAYYPYAQNYEHYMTAQGEIRDLDPFFYNVIPSFWLRPGGTELPLANPFFPYVWYAAGGLALVLAVKLFGRRKPKPVAPPPVTPAGL